MNAVQGTRSVSKGTAKSATQRVATKIKEIQAEQNEDVVFVCMDGDSPRFDLILDPELKIRGVRDPQGTLIFRVDSKDADRVRRHHHVTTGKVVEA